MGWVVALALIALIIFWLWRLAEFRGARLEWLGAALLVGLAGYAWQGSPVMSGSPTQERREFPPEGSTDLEAEFINSRSHSADRWMQFAESLNRAGNHLGASQAVRNALEDNPDDPDLWVALGNSLLLHGQGRMNPAAQLAFQRAAEIDPTHPGPPFFTGLALAQGGQLDAARQVWSDLLQRTPEDAPFRADLENRLAGINSALGLPPEPAEAPETATP
ncbi:MAG: tetratricopeptide repeat protein [Sphingomonadaceae bacterium]|nr:tetratricopeptide repeat protein [Sphingomonadaceae bacterium]